MLVGYGILFFILYEQILNSFRDIYDYGRIIGSSKNRHNTR